MKSYYLVCLLVLCIAFPSLAANHQGQQKLKPTPRLEHIPPDSYIQGEVIVKMSPARPDALHKSAGDVRSLNAILSAMTSSHIEPMFNGHTTPPSDPSLVDLSKYFVVRYAGPGDAVAVAKLLMQADDVEFAEPRFEYKASAVTPNDPFYPQQWHLPQIHAPEAWAFTQGDSSVVIGIDDTGVDIDHEDLKSNVWHNPGEMGLDSHGNDKQNNGVDDDDNGFIDDWQGWDFYGQDNNPRPGPDHGTHVAGLAAAVTNNNIGVAGVAPHCRLLPIKVSPDASSSDKILFGYEGIVYAADLGARIVNCSWSGSGYSQAGQDVITYATQKGTLVVAAAGNSNANIDVAAEYPAAYTGVLAVGSTRSGDFKSSFSNFGYAVSVSAPGENILSSLPGNTYNFYDGTSMASPIAAGVAALVASQNPGYTPLQIGQQVRISADNIDALNPYYPHLMGFGRVNAYRALTYTSPAIRMSGYSVNDSAFGDNDGVFDPGDTIQVAISLMNYLLPSGPVTVSLTSTSTYITIQTLPQNIGSIGTLQSVQLSPFYIKIKNNAPENQRISCLVTITDGSYTDYGTFMFVVHPTYMDMNINKITMTVTSRGNLAYSDYPDNRQGSGFRYDETSGLDYLFEGAFMMGTDAGHVVDAARSGDGNTQIADFAVVSNFLIQAPGSIADQQGSGIFNDSFTPTDSALGVRVRYSSYSFTDTTNDDFVLLRYDVTNTSTNLLSNFCAGLYLDWDVGTSGNNKTAIDTDLRLAYVYDTTTGTPAAYTGIVMLSQEPLVFRAIDNAATGTPWGVYDGFTKSEKWNALGGGVSDTARGPSDISMVIGLGPHPLSPGDSVTVPYALMAAMTLSDLRATAQRAIRKWELIRDLNDYEALTPFTFALSQNYPNPFNGGTIIRYTVERQANVTLKVFDLLGREIETLVHRVQSPGSYDVRFPQSKTLASGVYFYRLESDGHSFVRKMVYIR
jgi:serine protease